MAKFNRQIINTLNKLTKQYPGIDLHQHVVTALADYKSGWVSDKVFSTCLNKYVQDLESCSPIEDVTSLEQELSDIYLVVNDEYDIDEDYYPDENF